MKEEIGDLFQKETKYFRGKLSGGPLLWHKKPDAYKHYPSALKLELSPPETAGGARLWDAVRKRRSIRNYRNQPLSEAHLSQLLWATQGITRQEMGFAFRSAPSAGALYPVETYVAVHSVESIDAGIYHYGIQKHELELLNKGDFRDAVARAALDQDMAYSASIVFIWTALFQRSKWKYGQRAYRYIYIDAGHIAQNLALTAVSLGLGSCQIAALYDDEVNSLLGIDGIKESVLYMSSVGHPL
jgi:SagB-type dehydrogenase family enzyme